MFQSLLIYHSTIRSTSSSRQFTSRIINQILTENFIHPSYSLTNTNSFEIQPNTQICDSILSWALDVPRYIFDFHHSTVDNSLKSEAMISTLKVLNLFIIRESSQNDQIIHLCPADKWWIDLQNRLATLFEFRVMKNGVEKTMKGVVESCEPDVRNWIVAVVKNVIIRNFDATTDLSIKLQRFNNE